MAIIQGCKAQCNECHMWLRAMDTRDAYTLTLQPALATEFSSEQILREILYAEGWQIYNGLTCYRCMRNRKVSFPNGGK